MPKGSKKRRAERRKKEHEIQTPPNGIEDPKLNDEKEIMEDVSSYTTTTTTGSSNQDLGLEEEESKTGLVSTGQSKEDEEVNQIIFSKDIKLEDHEEEKIVVIEGNYYDTNSRIIPIDSIKQSDFDSSSDGNNSSGSGSGSSSGGNSSDEESLQTNPIDKKEDEIEMKKENDSDSCILVTDSSSPPQYNQIEQEEVISSLSEDVNPTVEVSSAVKEALVEESRLNDIQSKDILPTNDDLITEISDGVDGNHQENHDISDKQHQQVAPAPPPLQPTSWKGCCGLFDVFMGSSR